MNFLSWSSAMLKFNGYEEITPNQLQQMQQQADILSTNWPWLSEQSSGTNRTSSSLLLDLAVLETAAANHFWNPSATSSLAMANLMSATIMDKQNQLSFGIDRILGDQIGVHRSAGFPQVTSHVWSRDLERQNLTQRQEVVVDSKQGRETRQEHHQQAAASEEQQSTNNNSRRKRSWSRAVFSNLQRKGLEKRFQLQKYITKPDRRQLAATLGLTDAQVKVWFQNRRMKWRHNKESCIGNNFEETLCNSPLEHYIETVENIKCMDDYNTKPDSSLSILPGQDIPNHTRFNELQKV